MGHPSAILNCVSLPALPGRNDSVPRRRPDDPIEDIKENGRKHDSQDNIHDSSPGNSLVQGGPCKPTSASNAHFFAPALKKNL
jgi:hypothetical protein